ncbi:11447_t:CDS:2, partial [Dentiscutata erythropus]
MIEKMEREEWMHELENVVLDMTLEKEQLTIIGMMNQIKGELCFPQLQVTNTGQ